MRRVASILTGARCAAVLCLGVLWAAQAGAATLTPADVAGGYSSSVSAPTAVVQGYTLITGTGGAGQRVEFSFPDLASGGSVITFTFSTPTGTTVQGRSNGYSYVNGGGAIFYSLGTPLSGAWGGTSLGQFAVNNGSTAKMTDTVTLTLPSGAAAPLYVGMNFTYGAAVQYAISAPANAVVTATPASAVTTPPAVPLPPAIWMLLSALAGLGLLKRCPAPAAFWHRRRFPSFAKDGSGVSL